MQNARQSTYDSLIDAFELLESNLNYAHIRQDDSLKRSVSLRFLAPNEEIVWQTNFDTQLTFFKEPLLSMQECNKATDGNQSTNRLYI